MGFFLAFGDYKESGYEHLCRQSLFFWNKCPRGVWLLGHMVSDVSVLGNCRTIFQNNCIIYSPTSNVWDIQLFYILASSWCYHYFFNLSCPDRCVRMSYRGLYLHFRNSQWRWTALMCLFAIYIPCSVKCLSCPFCNWVLPPSLLLLWKFFICSRFESFIRYGVCNLVCSFSFF